MISCRWWVFIIAHQNAEETVCEAFWWWVFHMYVSQNVYTHFPVHWNDHYWWWCMLFSIFHTFSCLFKYSDIVFYMSFPFWYFFFYIFRLVWYDWIFYLPDGDGKPFICRWFSFIPCPFLLEQVMVLGFWETKADREKNDLHCLFMAFEIVVYSFFCVSADCSSVCGIHGEKARWRSKTLLHF